MKQKPFISREISPESLAEVREYTNLPITLIDEPFAKNHLFCVRGKYCEFAEYQNFVHVYIYTTVNTDKETLYISPIKEMLSGNWSVKKVKNLFPSLMMGEYEKGDGIWYTHPRLIINETHSAESGSHEILAKAICTAVNNTYGQSINPESVPAMYRALKDLIEFAVIIERHTEHSYSKLVEAMSILEKATPNK